jgi:hypothetical protein
MMTAHPDFILGYWGSAMSLNQLLWNSESPAQSWELLQAGRAAQRQFGVVLSAREEMYYEAAEALNAPHKTTFDRYSAFAGKCSNLFNAYADDENAAAYALLSLQVIMKEVLNHGNDAIPLMALHVR